MKKISAREFKARCLKIIDEVQATRETVVITEKGRAIAKLVPAEKRGRQLFGCLAGKVEIVGGIESRIEPPEVWEVLR